MTEIDELCKEGFRDLQIVIKSLRVSQATPAQVNVSWKYDKACLDTVTCYRKLGNALRSGFERRLLYADRLYSMKKALDKPLLELLLGGSLAKCLARPDSISRRRGVVRKKSGILGRLPIPPRVEVTEELFVTGCPPAIRSYHDLHGMIQFSLRKGHYKRVMQCLENVRERYNCSIHYQR